MNVRPLALEGVFQMDPEWKHDMRGGFARIWCKDVMKRYGTETEICQISCSWNPKAGTLRGMHFQRPPHEEAKLVRVTSGRIFDVVVDLRRESKSYGKWIGVELSVENGTLLVIPKGCAHGFQTLEHNTMVEYHISTPYSPNAAAGIRWNDPFFGINWPADVTVISDRDANFPDFSIITES